ncbi:SGNH/GDSL hydrolase family protein [Sporobolomyces salmoneus]|uniref:SGNH/GDSL hydrolase family protein n=1 Tax=Sporobolomyces salmoneus TaxID=183962 RepID=UPI0031823376
MVHQYESLDSNHHTTLTPLGLPSTSSSSSSSTSPSLRRTRFRPTLPTLSLALIHISFFLWWTHQARPTLDKANSILSTSSHLQSHEGGGSVPVPVAATGSCEVCVNEPGNALCEYGMNSVRMSRQYEGSGVRVRRALEKALRGEEIGIGILGASVTAGHSVQPGQQKWQEKFYNDFLTMFPNAKMHVGAVSATDSRFFSYCYEAVVPTNLDLYIVELDINNNPGLETLRDDDALMRGLLQLPQQPAVIRVSAIAILFEELARGAVSTLITSEFFDVPVIGIRFLIPHLIKHREPAEVLFGLDQWGNRDYRHMSNIGHAALADMLSLYIRKEVCETKRLELAPIPSRSPESLALWPLEEDMGAVPELALWSKWLKPEPLKPITPLCRTVNTPLSPLTPLSHSPLFTLISWNGKHAWSSSSPGAQIRFSFKGTKVGIFVYTTNGKASYENPTAEEEGTAEGKKKRRMEAPGMAVCWIEEVGGKETPSGGRVMGNSWEVESHWPERGPAGAEFVELTEGLDPGEHILACEVSRKSTSGGYKWRVQGVASKDKGRYFQYILENNSSSPRPSAAAARPFAIIQHFSSLVTNYQPPLNRKDVGLGLRDVLGLVLMHGKLGFSLDSDLEILDSKSYAQQRAQERANFKSRSKSNPSSSSNRLSQSPSTDLKSFLSISKVGKKRKVEEELEEGEIVENPKPPKKFKKKKEEGKSGSSSKEVETEDSGTKGKGKGKGKAKAKEEESEGTEQIGSIDREGWKARQPNRALPTRAMAPRVSKNGKGKARDGEEEEEERYDDSTLLAEKPGSLTNWALNQIIDPSNEEQRPHLPLYDDPDENGDYFGEKKGSRKGKGKVKTINNLGEGILDLVMAAELSREQLVDRRRKDRDLKIELGEEEGDDELEESYEGTPSTDEQSHPDPYPVASSSSHQILPSEPSSSPAPPTNESTHRTNQLASSSASGPSSSSSPANSPRSSSPEAAPPAPTPSTSSQSTDQVRAAEDAAGTDPLTTYFTSRLDGSDRNLEFERFVEKMLFDQDVRLDNVDAEWERFMKPKLEEAGLPFDSLPFDSILQYFLPHIQYQRNHPEDPIKLAVLFLLECSLPDNVELMDRYLNGTQEGESSTAQFVRFLLDTYGPLLSDNFLIFADDIFRRCVGRNLRTDFRRRYGREPSQKLNPGDHYFSFASNLLALLYGLLAKDRIKVEMVVASGAWARQGAGLISKPTKLADLNGTFPFEATAFPYESLPPSLPIHHATIIMRTKKSSVKSILVARSILPFAIAEHSQDHATSLPSFDTNVIRDSMTKPFALGGGGATPPLGYLKSAYDLAKAADGDSSTSKGLKTEVQIASFDWLVSRAHLFATDTFEELWVKLGIAEEDETEKGFGVHGVVEKKATVYPCPPGHGALMREAAMQKRLPSMRLVFKNLPPVAQKYLEEAQVYEDLNDETEIDASWVLSTIRKRWYKRDKDTLLKDVPNGLARGLPAQCARDLVDVYMSVRRDPHFHLLKWLPLFFPIEQIHTLLKYGNYKRSTFGPLIFNRLQDVLPDNLKIRSRDKRVQREAPSPGNALIKPHENSIALYALKKAQVAQVFVPSIFDSSLRAEGFANLWIDQQGPLGGPHWVAGSGLGWAMGGAASVGLRRFAALRPVPETKPKLKKDNEEDHSDVKGNGKGKGKEKEVVKEEEEDEEEIVYDSDKSMSEEEGPVSNGYDDGDDDDDDSEEEEVDHDQLD